MHFPSRSCRSRFARYPEAFLTKMEFNRAYYLLPDGGFRFKNLKGPKNLYVCWFVVDLGVLSWKGWNTWKDYNFRDILTVRMPDFYSDEELQMLQPALDGILRTPPERNWTQLVGLHFWALWVGCVGFAEILRSGSMKSPHACIMDTWHHRLADDLPSNKHLRVRLKIIEE